MKRSISWAAAGSISRVLRSWVSSTPRGASSPHFYYVVLAVVLGSGLLLWRIDRSPFGNALEAIRDNETRATFIGLPVRALPLVGVRGLGRVRRPGRWALWPACPANHSRPAPLARLGPAGSGQGAWRHPRFPRPGARRFRLGGAGRSVVLLDLWPPGYPGAPADRRGPRFPRRPGRHSHGPSPDAAERPPGTGFPWQGVTE